VQNLAGCGICDATLWRFSAFFAAGVKASVAKLLAEIKKLEAD
jgi:hypothetical protein